MATELTSKTCQFHNLKVNVTERAGKSPAIIFIPGVSMTGEIWKKQLESELLQDYQLIAIDLPGHGTSDNSASPATDYTIPGYAAAITEMIQQLPVDEFVLVGYSLGGNAAIEALPALEKCIGIMAVTTAVATKPFMVEKAFQANPALATIFKEDANDEEISTLANALFAAGYNDIPKSFKTDFQNTDPKVRGTLAQCIAEGNYEDEVAILNKVQIPVAIVTGTDDQFGNPEYLKTLPVPKWTDAAIEVPGAGHMPQLENSEFFNAALLRFIVHCQAEREAARVP
ncbi:alpha/beta fold hydrolase [Botryobacter ruber]|uniref:alpha/beta fold hydrolase n=1 Tax=Botryobacter ruber TaxID=2171629 RepID=UPI000E09FA44|nr:alpha/beta hydrolase [Botryobacter ruber]